MNTDDRNEIRSNLQKAIEEVLLGYGYVGNRTAFLMAEAATTVYENGLDVFEYLKTEA